MKRLKVLTVVGTRPEIIRLSQVIKRLYETENIEHILIPTGQNEGINKPNNQLPLLQVTMELK